MPDGDAAVAFVKKERKGNFRKKERVKSDEEEADAANIRKQIEETKLEHKLRGRVVGVEANKLMVNSGLKEHKVVAEDNEAEASMLDTQFSAEANVDTSHVGLMEQEMLKYIDKKLKGDEAEEQTEQRKKSHKDELYDVPDHLKIEKNKPEADAQDNGAETWLTGIVEVELPMDDKLRNIEETERAKKKILDERIKGVNSSAFIVDTSSDKGYARIDAKAKNKRGSSKRPVDDKPAMDARHAQLATGTGGNFSANFVQRGGNREVREAAAGQAPNAGSIEGGGGGGKRTELSSDDLVMERFKKRFCMKK